MLSSRQAVFSPLFPVPKQAPDVVNECVNHGAVNDRLCGSDSEYYRSSGVCCRVLSSQVASPLRLPVA